MSEAPERIFFDQRDKRPRIITVPHMAEPPVSPFVREYVPADLLAAKDAEIERLRRALASVLAACDQGRMMPRPGSGAGGMTVEANIRSSIYTGVPAWPIEEARAALTDPAAFLPDQK